MKFCLIHEMLGCIYAYLVLEVGPRDLDKSFHISYLYIENFCLKCLELDQTISSGHLINRYFRYYLSIHTQHNTYTLKA